MYYNTTNLEGQKLASAQRKAKSQSDIILGIFKRQHGHILSPSMVYKLLSAQHPITSIRRSFTDLTSRGDLIKLTKKRIGLYGRDEHYWKLAR